MRARQEGRVPRAERGHQRFERKGREAGLRWNEERDLMTETPEGLRKQKFQEIRDGREDLWRRNGSVGENTECSKMGGMPKWRKGEGK